MGRKPKDLTGQRFGKLTAVAPTDERKRGTVVWECHCDCGNTVLVPLDYLVTGKTKSCGCLAKENAKGIGKQRAKDLTGQRFGRLVAVRPTERRQQTFIIWECQCDCGKNLYATSGSLAHGSVKSCGCFRADFRWKSSSK